MGKGELADTTQPSTDDIIKIYESPLKKGYSIISPLMAANMSGTVNAANATKKALGNPDIYIFDSQFNSLGLGYQVLEIAKKLYEEEMSKEDVIKEIEI